LHGKTGISETDISEIVQFINGIDTTGEMSDRQLAMFHKKLEAFYRNE